MRLLALAATLTVSACPIFIADDISFSTAPLFPFISEGKLGFHDPQGRIVIPPRFDGSANPHPGFFDGAARVYLDGQALFIDEHGSTLFSCPPKIAIQDQRFSEGRLPFHDNGLTGFLDKSGNPVIPAQFAFADDFSEGLAAFRPAAVNAYGYIDKQGNIIIPPQFKLAHPFSEGRAAVQTPTGEWGYIDTSGTLVIPAVFQQADSFSEGLASVQTPSGWGYIDRDARTIVPFQYRNAVPFTEGLAAVANKDAWGYIDRTGNIVIPFQYDHATSFAGGLAYTMTANASGYINPSGTLVLPSVPGLPFRHGLVPTLLPDRKLGYLNKSGQLIQPHN